MRGNVEVITEEGEGPTMRDLRQLRTTGAALHPRQKNVQHTLSKYTLLLSKMQGEDISAVPAPQ